MSGPPVKTLAAITLALGMWFVPSLSTQGAGTVGRQLPHPDRVLVVPAGHDAVMPDTQLHLADAGVRTALPR